MTSAATETSTWDFSPVFNLIDSLTHTDNTTQREQHARLRRESSFEPTSPLDDGIEGGLGLGNFNKIWDYLGVQRSVPPPTVPPFEAATSGNLLRSDRDAYASDSALYFASSAKGVRWRDEETEGADLADTQPETPPKTGLTKSQRKKRNRKERRADETASLAEQLKQDRSSVDSGSDADMIDVRSISAISPAVKAVSQSKSTNSVAPSVPVQDKPVPKVAPVTRFMPTTPLKGLQNSTAAPSTASTPTRTLGKITASTPTASIKKPTHKPTNALLLPAQVAPSTKGSPSLAAQIDAQLKDLSNFPSNFMGTASPSNPKTLHDVTNTNKQLSAPKPVNTRMHSMPPGNPVNASFLVVPSTPQPKIPKDFASYNVTQTSTPTRKRHELLPVAYQTAADRNWSLLLKLLRSFPAERDSLLSPLQLSINRPQPNGIHVFVDASNILIGFHDALKRARGIPQGARVPRPDLSFHALALLLERRRTVTKRVLAGSTPEISAFEEARQVGYETCILDKVFKAKELTERQKRFAQRAMSSSSERYYASGSASDGNGNVPSTDAPPAQQPKWVEQAVDEILHLKMMESLIDTDVSTSATAMTETATRAPTMVLATGDAAEAEYSPGFMRMVERALGKGWTVEVVAWGANISMGYRRMEKKAQWGERFKIIELDEYAEELFGQSV